MFDLLRASFLGVDREGFEADLTGKTAVVLLRNQSGLVGFSTFALVGETSPWGLPASVLCSGDTIVDPAHWGSSELGRTLILSALELHRASGRDGLWWLLITSGPRTWGVLPTFFHAFEPMPAATPEPVLAAWLNKLCQTRWPGCVDAGGIVRLAKPQRLRPPLDAIPQSRRGDSGVRWYDLRNPNWRDGDELPSLVRIDARNLTRAGRRYLGASLEHRG
jgi:hypothetical protein